MKNHIGIVSIVNTGIKKKNTCALWLIVGHSAEVANKDYAADEIDPFEEHAVQVYSQLDYSQHNVAIDNLRKVFIEAGLTVDVFMGAT